MATRPPSPLLYVLLLAMLLVGVVGYVELQTEDASPPPESPAPSAAPVAPRHEIDSNEPAESPPDPAAVWIRGRVLDESDGRPVAGAAVVFSAGGPAGPGTSDDDGRFALRVSRPEGRLNVRAEGYLPRTLDATSASPALVRLQRTTLLTVRVVHPNGTPAPEALVEITPPTPPGRHRANAAGLVKLSGLKSGPYRLKAATADNKLAASGEAALAERAHQSVTLTLAPSASISGVVQESDGTPAAGASVWAQSEDGTQLGSGVAGGDGRFALVGLAHSEAARVHAVKDGRYGAGDRIALPRGSARAGVVVKLGKGEAAIAGIVLDDDGAPVAGASVELAPAYEGGEALWGSQATDDDGRFRFASVEEGLYDLTARHGDLEAVLDGVRAGQQAAVLQLAATAQIVGSVAGETGAPVTRFHVKAEFARDVVPRTDSGNIRRPMSRSADVIDAEGRFALGPFRRGHYEVEVSTDDGRIGRAKGDVRGRATLDVGVIRLEAAGRVVGRVVDKRDGRPVYGASVQRSWRASESAITDGEGRFSLRAPKGEVALSVEHPGYFPKRVLAGRMDPSGGTLDVGEIAIVPGTRREIEGRRGFGGVGAVLKGDHGKVLVDRLLPDGPATRAGLRNGDVLVSVDGEAVGPNVMDAVSIMRGEAGNTVWIRVRRGEEEVDIPVRREPIDFGRN